MYVFGCCYVLVNHALTQSQPPSPILWCLVDCLQCAFFLDNTLPEIDLGTLVNFEEVVDVVAGLGGHDTRGRGR